MNISHFDSGSPGPPLHFLHANGYPPDCYRPLLEQLAGHYHVFGMLLRPLWPDARPEELTDWQPLSDDLLRFLHGQKTGAVIGMGHSIGATVTLRSAMRDPSSFRALVLIDPVLFPWHFMLRWGLIRWLGLGYRWHPLIPAALKRRRSFDDLDTVFSAYRRRPVFRYFPDGNLKAYIHGMTRPQPAGGYQLVYSPEWEARIYYTGAWNDWDIWNRLPDLEVPTLILRGAETDTFWESTADRVRVRNPKIRIVTLEKSTHLLPLERPQEVYDQAQSFLKEVL